MKKKIKKGSDFIFLPINVGELRDLIKEEVKKQNSKKKKVIKKTKQPKLDYRHNLCKCGNVKTKSSKRCRECENKRKKRRTSKKKKK